ncbi:low molecular weight phosphotyrosine protein phosphatase [Vibrio parahaemolyticus]|uniref:low molecular weight protein-tyrosine-phosphatase n=1 Tax=Vibrio parahaemolyticus TaxID=670 RepID=UPI001EEC39A3|nr:low molecular weight protein-tyrosine-phosphatase [Vibrio parahaemolyticus]MCG6466222.1 low molecular weight phosphotyrosine protein phosphatase [Vibrio parahaemolyticus]MCG6488634.1 low molecular weight phosphotyrosine protein phosphatase [Vibrio parahaemolyticus]
MKKILVVCMGNICRSPTGEAVLRAKAGELGVDVDIDSAGTIGYHTGNTPDTRAMAAGKQRGYSFKGMRARQVSVQDFEDFDLVLAADKANLADLLDICPAEHRHKVSLFLSYSNSSYDEIPDPYYGGDDGFELVLDLIEEASVAVLQKL